jgi:hypothetical protein
MAIVVAGSVEPLLLISAHQCSSVQLAGRGHSAYCLCPAGVNYGSGANGGVHIGSNSYITFGAGSDLYSSLGPSNPARPSIHIGSQDNSMKGVWAGAVSGCFRWAAVDAVLSAAQPAAAWLRCRLAALSGPCCGAAAACGHLLDSSAWPCAGWRGVVDPACQPL